MAPRTSGRAGLWLEWNSRSDLVGRERDRQRRAVGTAAQHVAIVVDAGDLEPADPSSVEVRSHFDFSAREGGAVTGIGSRHVGPPLIGERASALRTYFTATLLHPWTRSGRTRAADSSLADCRMKTMSTPSFVIFRCRLQRAGSFLTCVGFAASGSSIELAPPREVAFRTAVLRPQHVVVIGDRIGARGLVGVERPSPEFPHRRIGFPAARARGRSPRSAA